MKKLYTTLALVLVLLAQFTFAQAPAIEWQKALGGSTYDQAYSIQQTTDGGYVVAGYTYSSDGDVIGNHGGIDCWIVKFSSTGTIQWQKTLGGTGTDCAKSIQQTTDGGYIVAGYTSSNDGDVTGNHGGNYDFWIVKLSDTGTLQWQKTYGGSSEDDAYSIQQTTDGGYIVGGITTSNDGDVTVNQGFYDCWVVKISANGILQWQKTFGGTQLDDINKIEQTTDGGYIVAGNTLSINGDVTGNHGVEGSSDCWVVKLSATGTIQWQKTLGCTYNDGGNSIQQTLDGGYIVAGYSQTNNGDVTGNHGGSDYWVVKLSATGTIQWQKSLGGSGVDVAYSIQQTIEGGYIIAGYSSSNDGNVTGNHGNQDYWVVKISATGTLQWQKTLGGTGADNAQSIQQTTDGGYIIAGYTSSNDGDVTGYHGNQDYWVVKLAPDTFGTNVFSKNEFKLFPNPTASTVTLQNPNNFNIDKIIITDLAGKTVMEQTTNTTQINVENLASGIYILQAFSGEEKFISKFLKE